MVPTLLQITHDAWNHDTPSWSPDGRKFAFVSDRNKHSVVYVMNVDGSGLERLSPENAESIHPNWSPDSRQVIYCADDDLKPPKKNDASIYSVDVQSKVSQDVDHRRCEYLSFVVAGWKANRLPKDDRRYELGSVCRERGRIGAQKHFQPHGIRWMARVVAGREADRIFLEPACELSNPHHECRRNGRAARVEYRGPRH